jgi:hypothetical protein
LPFRSRTARFKVGDDVTVIGPGIHRNKHGFVVEVIEPSTGDFVYRYVARFGDGTAATFFGFELQISQSSREKRSA